MSKYILIDGPDGTGKTTLTRNLEQEMPSSKRIHFPTTLPKEENLASSTTEILFYLNDFDENLQCRSHPEKNLILDRSFVSTLAYQGFRNKGYKKKEWAIRTIMGMGTEMIHDRSDVYFVHLTCSIKERIDRLMEKEDQDRVGRLERAEMEEKLSELDRTFKRSYALLEKNHPEFTYLTLDSTDNPPQELLSLLLKQLS